jgi:hypothetical protein
MSCKSCQSPNQCKFESEVSIYFPGLANLKKSPVLAYPHLQICLNCGFLESKLSDDELRELIQGSGDKGRSEG